jgi:mannose-6-phosphate isomerase
MNGACRRRGLGLALLAAPLAGCDWLQSGPRLDGAWHRRALLDGHLTPWRRAALQPNGACRGGFTRDWSPRPGGPATVDLTHQARLIVAFAAGHEAAQGTESAASWLAAAESAGRFLLTHLRDPEHGGFFHQVSPTGERQADAKRGYGHAFALLALAELCRLSPDPAWPAAALDAWRTVEQGLLDRHGGLVSDATRRFVHVSGPARSQNPGMHLFEALLALAQAPQADVARAGLLGARRVSAWMLNRLLQGLPDGGAMVPEWYDADWTPRTGPEAETDLGHQFEWVHLLITANRLGVSPTLGAVAERVLQFALAQGYDEIDGGCFTRWQPGGRVDRRKGWWQQAECLHGLMVAADANPRPELWRRVEQTLTLVKRTLIDPQHGGWRPGADCLDRGCEDQQPDPYHMAQMHRTAWRLAG